MEQVKSILISILVLGAAGAIVYFSFNALETGTEHVFNEKVQQLEDENEDLKKEIEDLNDKLALLKETPAPAPAPSPVPSPSPSSTQSGVYKYQDLINQLGQLVKENVVLKPGSKGSKVGTLQKFLNVYGKSSDVVDNDFGAGTQKDVIDFQTSEKLSADGEAGPGTFNKMIDWLKKQG